MVGKQSRIRRNKKRKFINHTLRFILQLYLKRWISIFNYKKSYRQSISMKVIKT